MTRPPAPPARPIYFDRLRIYQGERGSRFLLGTRMQPYTVIGAINDPPSRCVATAAAMALCVASNFAVARRVTNNAAVARGVTRNAAVACISVPQRPFLSRPVPQRPFLLRPMPQRPFLLRGAVPSPSAAYFAASFSSRRCLPPGPATLRSRFVNASTIGFAQCLLCLWRAVALSWVDGKRAGRRLAPVRCDAVFPMRRAASVPARTHFGGRNPQDSGKPSVKFEN